MTATDGLALIGIVGMIWIGWPLHQIAVDLRWVRQQIEKRP